MRRTIGSLIIAGDDQDCKCFMAINVKYSKFFIGFLHICIFFDLLSSLQWNLLLFYSFFLITISSITFLLSLWIEWEKPRQCSFALTYLCSCHICTELCVAPILAFSLASSLDFLKVHESFSWMSLDSLFVFPKIKCSIPKSTLFCSFYTHWNPF